MIAPASGIQRSDVERIVREVILRRLGASGDGPQLVVNISARHMHITQEHLEVLFGPGAQLTVMKPLYQEGEFASEQRVTLVGPRHRMIPNFRILGPCRKATQVELSFTDAIAIGIDAPVRMSGTTQGTPGCLILGPKGHLALEEGVIRAQRHVHLNPQEAAYFGVKEGDPMRLIVEHPTCGTVLEGVIARIKDGLKCEVHLDTDEGNACDLTHAAKVELIKA
ncbi:MAG: phosphate propanoyltransferase [Phycisphaerae bacterium]|nr:phosphate propanoyltransferase [Phycisphaerae bacterium]